MKHRRALGSVLVLTAVLVAVLVFMLALAVDVGLMYAVRNKAQNAADAAALAGAWAVKLGGDVAGGACTSAAAAPAAVAAAALNPVLGQVLTPSPVTATTCTDGYGQDHCCVSAAVNASSPIFFARVFGWTPVSMSASAIAQTNSAFFGFGQDCLKPIFIPDQAYLTVPPNPSTTCSSTSTNIANASLTAGSLASPVLCNIRPTDPSGSLVPSNYYSLDYSSLLAPANNPNAVEPVAFSDGTYDTNGGASLYRDTWTKCMVNTLKCGQQIRVQTGVSQGPTSQGVEPILNQSFWAPVWNSSQQTRSGNEFFATVTGFVHLSNLQCVNAGGGGNGRGNGNTCNNSSNIQAAFDKYVPCSSPGLTTGIGSYETPVRLVNPGFSNSD